MKLDVLFAPDLKKGISNEETNNLSDISPESSNVAKNENDNESTPEGDKENSFSKVFPQTVKNLFIYSSENTHFLMAFSIKRTGKALFDFEEDDGTFRCIDGLKGLATVPLFLTLKLLTFGHLPFTNKAQLSKVIPVNSNSRTG